MGVPRQRQTKSARNKRRAHHALAKTNFAKCKNCGYAVMPHAVCKNCGFYKGREVIKIKSVAATKTK